MFLARNSDRIPDSELPSSNSSKSREPAFSKKLFLPWKSRFVLAKAHSTSSASKP